MKLDDWNEALLAEIRTRGQPCQRLYLYVDRDFLARLSGLSPADAVADFHKAFQAADEPRPFHRAAEAAARWKENGFPGEPSFVVYLAMTVLAVTEEPLGNPHGVYRRQNMLLGLPAEASAPPGYGEDVPTLWKVWNAWLEGPGSVHGRSSARTHFHWRLQGWARSQGLVRHQDRLLIERFMEDFGAAPESLSVARLRQWLGYRGAPARGLLTRLEDEAAQAVVQDVIDDEAARWRQEGRRARPGGQVRGLLHYDDWSRTFSGAVEVDPAWCGKPVDVGQGRPYIPSSFEAFLLVTLTAPTQQLLHNGVVHHLTERVAVQFGGDEVYVMRDEPRVDGRLQCSAVHTAANYHVLAYRPRVDRLSQALHASGVVPRVRESTVDGWLWLENIRLDEDSELVRLLGMAALMPTTTDRPRLEGGLSLAGGTYLVGGEPDVTAPADQLDHATLDGRSLRARPQARRVTLAERCLDPGEHTVTTPSGRVTFHTRDFAKEKADPDGGGISRPLQVIDSIARFGEPTRVPATPTVLAGAALSGIDAPEPLTLRRAAKALCLVVAEDGSIDEIWPAPPAWLRRIGLDPATIDVLDAVRTTASLSAFLVVRRRDHWQWAAIATSAPRLPGRSRSRPRQDLVAELVAQQRRWVGEPDEKRARRVLSLALGLGELRRATDSGQGTPTAHTPSLRADVVRGRLADNPYDDMLIWLSEQERGRVPAARFADTWAWLCRRHGRGSLAGGWRTALATLSALGHIERDYGRGQVATAPGALVSLPSAGGLSVLAGARPTRLLERMDDPDDPDPLVAATAERWTLHYRTPTDLEATPTGPTAVYVDWDRSDIHVVRDGLAQLGVSMYGCIAAQLLRMYPSLTQAVDVGQQLLMSPGGNLWRWCRTAGGSWEWAHSRTDAAPGLYRYRLRFGSEFAWRAAAGAPLVRVEPAVGRWLALADRGHTSLLVHSPRGRMLLVPAYAPLPELLARALTLRTGLPRYQAAVQRRADQYLVYENVDVTTSETVASLLLQKLQVDSAALRMG